MKEKALHQFKEFIRNKNIAVVGLGRSNLPLIQFLLKYSTSITGFDKATEDKLSDILPSLSQKGVKFSLGEQYLEKIEDFDLIFRTPGMRPDHPAFLKAIKKGAQITSEMEIFFDLCPAPIYAVTGSDGKTTTTTLIYKLLNKEGFQCHLGGNIGKPLIDQLENIEESHRVVLELSSFQLMNMKKSPYKAVITNITPNHLDVHTSMEEYVDAKKNIFKYQETGHSQLILNYDNPLTRSFKGEAKGEVLYFSRQDKGVLGLVVEGDAIVLNKGETKEEILKLGEILLPGLHNVENFMAALGATLDVVKLESIVEVAKSFTGVEHRIEPVRVIKGATIYNDSIASSPTRTIAGLRSFEQKVILMAGGCDKKNDYTELGNVMLDTVKELVLVGPTGPKIAKALEEAQHKTQRGQDIQVHHMDSFENGVKKLIELTNTGDVAMLSPASTSFDLFKNFEERGKYFKELVSKY